MKTSLKKMVLALGSLAVLGVATNASAFPAFSIQPGAIKPTAAVPGGVGPLDTIKGGASERLLVTGADTFSGSGLLTLDGFYNGATIKYSPTLSSNFGMYVTFSLTDMLTSGTLGQAGSTYKITSLDFKIFADPANNNVYTPATNASDPTVVGAGDDVLVGFGSLMAGAAAVVTGGGSTGGALNSTESLYLCSGAGAAKTGGTSVTAAGDARAAGCAAATGTGFFFSPSPFYSVAFDEFNNTLAVFDSTTGTLALTGGSGSINFAIPEPDSVALLGIAAVAAGLATRRRRKA